MPSSGISSPSRSSISSASAPATTRSLQLFGVPIELTKEDVLKDLRKQCPQIRDVTRLFVETNEETVSIRVFFESEKALQTVLDKNILLINGKSRKFRVFKPLICRRCNNEGHYQSDCPQQPITEDRLMQLLEIHQQKINTTISEFERRWNERLSSLTNSGSSSQAKMNEQWVPILRDLTSVCQQNSRTQQQLNSVVQRLQQVQTTNNSQSIQNGH